MRVDAGFVAGDEVSSHYDPMIAKLIVQGPTRETAIQKLHAALDEYEIAGPITNIEFLKRVCRNPAFIAGDVETGFIPKWKDTLFAKYSVAPEVYAQAALGLFLQEATSINRESRGYFGEQSGFIHNVQKRTCCLIPDQTDGSGETVETVIEIEQLSAGRFRVQVNGTTYPSVASRYDSSERTVISYFPHTRLETRFITDQGRHTLFQQGRQYLMRSATPKWMEKALGIKDQAHSVLAPMPCKILRVEVSVGDEVKKDQALIVIESMKMETVIKSPQDGIVSRVVHGQGVSIAKYVLLMRMTNDHVGRICVRLVLRWWSLKPRERQPLIHRDVHEQ